MPTAGRWSGWCRSRAIPGPTILRRSIRSPPHAGVGLDQPGAGRRAGDDHRRHGRVETARKLGLAEAPEMVARGWSDPRKRAYVIADKPSELVPDPTDGFFDDE